MSENNYSSPPINLLKQLKSVIEGYSDHKDIDAALIQESIQNSKDQPKGGIPEITFKLEKFLDGDRLVITDENTTGLSGKRSSEEEAISQVLEQIDSSSNWDAFFAYSESTKTGDNTAGSRGQGKAALLYHSLVKLENKEKMMLIVDTLTTDENNKEIYRAQVKYVNPFAWDLFYSEGEKEVSNFLTRIDFSRLRDDPNFKNDIFKDEVIELGLKPLKKMGTRMIIPYLNPDTSKKFRDGITMKKWAQRIWWKAIQDEDIKIFFQIDDGKKEQIKVSKDWVNKPWEDDIETKSTDENGVFIYEDILFKPESKNGKAYCKDTKIDSFKIKQLVFSWDISRDEDELIPDADRTELSGVQWLRNNQWIETFSIKDIIDGFNLKIENLKEFKAGFRGFITFDESTEMFLRNPEYKIENPQHSSFSNQNYDIKQIKRLILNSFSEMADSMGWVVNEDQTDDFDQLSFEFLEEMGIFGKRSKEIKNELGGMIGLELGNNSPLKWGDSISNIKTKLFSLDNNKSLESLIYPKGRVRPLRPSGTQSRTRWTEDEVVMCYSIYRKHGATSLKRNYPMVRDFLMYSARGLKALEAQCMSFKELDDPPGLNYSELAKKIYEKMYEKTDAELEELFTEKVDIAKEKQKEDNLIKTSLLLKSPEEIVSIQTIEKYEDLTKNELLEDNFKDLIIDKSTYFEQKGKYSLIVIWEDSYGYELQRRERVFYVEEGKEDSRVDDFTPIVKIKNKQTDEIASNYNFEDEFIISVAIRNRTNRKLDFALDINLDSNDLSTDKKYKVDAVESGYEYKDTEIYSFEGVFVTDSTDVQKGKIAVQKGKVSLKFDFWDITERVLDLPIPIELRSSFTKGEDLVGVYKTIFIEQNNNGGAPFKRRYLDGTGKGKPIWKFNNNYLDREDVNVEIFREHPEKIRSENSSKATSYNYSALLKRIGCDATASLFVDMAMERNDKSFIIDAIDAAENININSAEPFELYKNTLEDLLTMNFEKLQNNDHLDFVNKIENSKRDLSSALFYMSLEI